MEVNVAPKQPGYKLYSEYLPLCSAEQRNSYRFGTTRGWVNDEIIVIFGWTIPLRQKHSPINKAEPRFANKWHLWCCAWVKRKDPLAECKADPMSREINRVRTFKRHWAAGIAFFAYFVPRLYWEWDAQWPRCNPTLSSGTWSWPQNKKTHDGVGKEWWRNRRGRRRMNEGFGESECGGNQKERQSPYHCLVMSNIMITPLQFL